MQRASMDNAWGPSACVHNLLWTSEQVEIQVTVLLPAGVKRKPREMHLLHIWRWDALGRTIRKVRLSDQDRMLYAANTVADRVPLIQRQVLGEHNKVLVETCMIHLWNGVQTHAEEMLALL